MRLFDMFQQGDPIIVVDGEYEGREGEVIQDFGPGFPVQIGLEGRIYSQEISRERLELDPTPRIESA